jgi:hypothetical protein
MRRGWQWRIAWLSPKRCQRAAMVKRDCRSPGTCRLDLHRSPRWMEPVRIWRGCRVRFRYRRGLKPIIYLGADSARLKSCPDTSCDCRLVFPQSVKPSFFIAVFLARLKSCPDTERLRISGAEARLKYDGIARGLKPPPPSGPILQSPSLTISAGGAAGLVPVASSTRGFFGGRRGNSSLSTRFSRRR